MPDPITLLKFIGLVVLVYGFGALLASKTPNSGTTFLFWSGSDDDCSS
jgi:hypothetical protein